MNMKRPGCFNRLAIGIFISVGFLPAPNAFSDPSAVDATFLRAAAAKEAIADDSLEPYFELLQPMEMSAKTGAPIRGGTLAMQRAECRRRYRAEVREFSRAEEAMIRRHVEALQQALTAQYPLMARMPWSFLKLTDRIEGGLPHTRGEHIVLSEGVCAKALGRFRSTGESALLHDFLETLAHERVHVFQRTHPGHMDSLYKEQWGFIKAESIAGCPWLTMHQLANPDATDCTWILPDGSARVKGRFLWPLVVLAEGEGLRRMPRDFRMVVVSLENSGDRYRVRVDQEGKPVFVSLVDVPVIRDLLELGGVLYHPHESAASVFSRLLLWDHFLDIEKIDPERLQKIERRLAPLRTWFRVNLALGS
jgi:hypothetical protein